MIKKNMELREMVGPLLMVDVLKELKYEGSFWLK